MALRMLRSSRMLRSLVVLHRGTAPHCCAAARAFSTSPEDASDVETDAEEAKETTVNNKGNVPGARFQGVYRAVMVGEVGSVPVERVLADGRSLVIFSLGTSGLITPKERNEELQWHKIGVYPERLKEIAKKVKKGGRVYLEGNLEMRLFNDNVTGILKRQREIAVRHDGQLIVLDETEKNNKGARKPTQQSTKAESAL